jgi:hypothetical protein
LRIDEIDQRLPGNRKLTLGYTYQRRLSHAVRDRYCRTALTGGYSTPLFQSGERLSLEVEYPPQRYERLVRVGDHREQRLDQRVIADATNERPITQPPAAHVPVAPGSICDDATVRIAVSPSHHPRARRPGAG